MLRRPRPSLDAIVVLAACLMGLATGCQPSAPSKPAACSSDDACELDTCSCGCTAFLLGTRAEALAGCKALRCFADPCHQLRASCVQGRCEVVEE